MRPFAFACMPLASLTIFAACSEPDVTVQPLTVRWMEWPARVPPAESFVVRQVGDIPVCGSRLVPAFTVDNSAVTFEPYALAPKEPTCITFASIAPVVFDESTSVPGLMAAFPRSYEIRAVAGVGFPGVVGVPLRAGLPVRTFGEITVSAGSGDRTNAGGFATFFRDTLDCARIAPFAIYSLPDGRPVSPESYVLDGSFSDSSAAGRAFVRGYLYEPTAPVCGEARVFHLVSRN